MWKLEIKKLTKLNCGKFIKNAAKENYVQINWKRVNRYIPVYMFLYMKLFIVVNLFAFYYLLCCRSQVKVPHPRNVKRQILSSHNKPVVMSWAWVSTHAYILISVWLSVGKSVRYYTYENKWFEHMNGWQVGL